MEPFLSCMFALLFCSARLADDMATEDNSAALLRSWDEAGPPPDRRPSTPFISGGGGLSKLTVSSASQKQIHFNEKLIDRFE